MNIIPRHRIEITLSSIFFALLFSRAKRIIQFKTELERYFNHRVMFLQSGRAALYYLLRAMPQEAIIVPAYTCKVVPEAALLAGKKIIYVDIDIHTFNMDVSDLKVKIRPNSIIIATHQYGIPCEIDKIAELAKENNCALIEDCAAAFGSKIKNRFVGTFGLASIFSFEFTKVLSAGRGGFVLFNENALYEETKLLVGKELRRPSPMFMAKIILMLFLHKIVTLPMVYNLFIRIFYRECGFSMDQGEIRPYKDELYRYSLSAFEAAMGLLNLKRVGNIIQRRWEIAHQYLRGLNEMKGLGLPVLPPHSYCSLMRFPVRILNQNRDEFYLSCLERGLDLGFTYTYSCSEDCRTSLLAASQVVNLPMNSSLTGAEVVKIISTIKGIVGTKSS
jgi:perosamine synthetase